ncbi:Rep family protein, partial [Lactobacillus gasseri]
MAENKKKNGNKIKKQVDKKKKHKTKEELREEVVKLSKKLGRVRNWTIIVYPESAPKNWRDIIDSTHVTWVEGPIHDKDV